MVSPRKALKRSKFAAFRPIEEGAQPDEFGNKAYKRARRRAKLERKKTMRDAKRARLKEAQDE